MTAAEFQTLVLASLAKLEVAVARIDERQQSHARQLDAFRSWRDAHEDKAEATGRHELVTVRQELATRRRELWGWAGKAALLLVGSVLAVLAPACSRLVGF